MSISGTSPPTQNEASVPTGVTEVAPTHTPGPWKIYRATREYPVTSLPPFELVFLGIGDAEAGGVVDARFGLWRDGPEREANARLIAAAPELLEALRGALPFIEDGIETPHELEAEHSIAARTLAETIRAAISKATGV